MLEKLSKRELINKIKELESLVNFYRYDALTGLKTRKDFDKDIKELINKRENVVVCIIDLDNLHNINRTKGYCKGDEYILENVSKLASVFNKENVYRIGGDEFAIIVKSDIEQICNKITMINDFFTYSCGKLLDYTSIRDLIKDLTDKINSRKKIVKRL